MSDFIKTLTRKNSLRKQCQDLAVSEIEKVVADLADILDDKKAAELAEREAEENKLAKIEAIRKTMEAAGLDMSDLVDTVDVSTRKKVAPKYRVVDESGETHEWSGRGRTPLAFQKFFDAGNSRDDCLIEKAV